MDERYSLFLLSLGPKLNFFLLNNPLITPSISLIAALRDMRLYSNLGKPLRSIRGIFERARKRAGLDDSVTIHTMRHTFESRLVMAGKDLRNIQELGGWSSLRMLERYAHLSPGHLQDAVDSIIALEYHLEILSSQRQTKKRRRRS